MRRMEELFGDRRPLIAMAHLRALPGTPAVRRRSRAGRGGRRAARRPRHHPRRRVRRGPLLQRGRPSLFVQGGVRGRGCHDPGGDGAGAQGPAVRDRLPLGPAGRPQHRRGHRRVVHPLRARRRLRIGHGPVEHRRRRAAARAASPRRRRRGDVHERHARVRQLAGYAQRRRGGAVGGVVEPCRRHPHLRSASGDGAGHGGAGPGQGDARGRRARLRQHRRQRRQRRLVPRRRPTASSSAPTSSATATRGTRSPPIASPRSRPRPGAG